MWAEPSGDGLESAAESKRRDSPRRIFDNAQIIESNGMKSTQGLVLGVTVTSLAVFALLRIGPGLAAEASPGLGGLPQRASAAGQGPGPGQGAPAAPGRAGGGGRGGAALALYNENCGGCHGTTSVAGRAPSLFDEKWLAGTTDDKI